MATKPTTNQVEIAFQRYTNMIAERERQMAEFMTQFAAMEPRLIELSTTGDDKAAHLLTECRDMLRAELKLVQDNSGIFTFEWVLPDPRVDELAERTRWHRPTKRPPEDGVYWLMIQRGDHTRAGTGLYDAANGGFWQYGSPVDVLGWAYYPTGEADLYDIPDPIT